MAVCFLSLGSNRGDRSRSLALALRLLAGLPKTRLVRCSRLFESSPVGAPGQRAFLNACAAIQTELSPMGLLIELKRIEAALGRRPGTRWGPRPLDIDILSYARRRMRTPLLALPHPRAPARRFVLLPLSEIHPPARAWLKRLNAPSQNVRLFQENPRRPTWPSIK